MTNTRNCGECLMNTVDIVALTPAGLCPKCGANYGPTQSFDAALQDYIAFARGVNHSYHKPDANPAALGVFAVDPGGKVYRRITVSSWGTSCSVYGFVRVADGAIMYAAGYRQPFIAKGDKGKPLNEQSRTTVRGNIYNPETWKGCTGWSAVLTVK